ncbi:MAG TPA: TlpA disulfide reductase family protein [Candidatus Rubrimentiphilum sp.]|nr:TlpA disulfide reductase family protein [Candidatus Rubrimentiphilum sp.]
MQRFWKTTYVLDAIAVALVLFVLYRLLIAPRFLPESAAYPAPAVTYKTLSGAPFALRSYRGRVVFLEFYASWCQPCKESLPLVESFARAHPEVAVIPIDVGEPRPLVAAFARAHGLSNVAYDPRALSRGFFQLEGYPTMVIVDPQSRIRATWEGLNPAVELNMAHAERVLASDVRGVARVR